MPKYDPRQRIKFAYYMEGWSFEDGDQGVLKNEAQKVLPSDYTKDMEGKIFCPVCFTNLIRKPKEGDYFSNGREAHFSHHPAYNSVKCDLRFKRSKGKVYDTYEEARKAIEDENLVIVSSFSSDIPDNKPNPAGVYDETPVEERAGPISDVPISRHTGETFPLPSKITTVAGICRNFDENVYKYYYLPGRKNAVRLIDLLKNVEDVIEEDSVPRLYYGWVKRSYTAVDNPQPHNIRMTELKSSKKIKDFYLKSRHDLASRKGIVDGFKDRYVLIWGVVTQSGLGLCIENVSWGEFAILPAKYNYIVCD